MTMTQPRAFWDAKEGWVVETPIALSPPQISAVVDWVRKVQGPRIRDMRGDKREQAAAALRSLSPATIKQRIVARPGAERVLYTRD
jgi:hypothetical protein